MKLEMVDTPTEEKAGRDLDARIAVEVLGWQWLERDCSDGVARKGIYPPDGDPAWRRFNFFADQWRPAKVDTERFSDWDSSVERIGSERGDEHYGLPHYSTRIAAAMEVVDHVAAPGVHFMSDYLVQRNGAKRWFAQFLRDGLADGLHNQWIEAPTLPEAICRAALEALTDHAQTERSWTK